MKGKEQFAEIDRIVAELVGAYADLCSMDRLLPILACGVIMLSGTGCTKDQDDIGYRPASISFRQDSGYIFMNDTLPAGDSIRVGVTVEEGSEQLVTFQVERSFDGQAAQQVETRPIPSVPFLFDTLIVLRNTPGSEQWSFLAVERNGDRTRRNLSW